MVWSVLYYLDVLTREKTKDLKIIVSDKYQLNSQMPFSYAGPLSEGAADPRRSTDVKPQDYMTWQNYVGTLDPTNNSRDNIIFIIGTEPKKMVTIMESVFDDFTPGEAQQKGAERQQQAEMLNAVVRE